MVPLILETPISNLQERFELMGLAAAASPAAWEELAVEVRRAAQAPEGERSRNKKGPCKRS